ncbi:MAG: class I SAM-dependent methyltransferase [Pseudomonadota bacterium]
MKKVTHCRACGSKALTPALRAPGAEAGFFSTPQLKDAYVLCDPSRHARACGLLQSATVDEFESDAPSARYASNRDHLRAMAVETLEMISGRDCAALDIGCNDGSLLSYYPRWVERFGVDPSDVVDEIGAWAWTAKDAFPSNDLDAAFGEKKFDIITVASTFEYVNDPRKFLAAVKARLSADGVFALETLYSPMVLTRNAIDVFQTGVTALYSLSVLEWLIRSEGMKVVKGALTAKEGGSIRLFITHAANPEFDFDPWNEQLARLWDEENALAMRALQPYQSFEERARHIRHDFSVMLGKIAGRSESVHMLGADAQAQAMLKWMGNASKRISAVVDTHRARDEDTLPGSRLPIISETDARAAEPDYFIAPARYKREILERWRESILLGAKIIFATPTPHIVTAANYASEYGKTIASGDTVGGSESLRSLLAAAGGPRLIAENKEIKSA